MGFDPSKYHIYYVQLLFFVGEYTKAEKLLEDLHNRYKTGDDYGAIHTLIRRGDLKYASQIAEKTLKWERGTPDPLRNSSAHGHCENYINNRAAAMGQLGLEHLKKNSISEATKITDFLQFYIRNKAFGQSSYCYLGAAERSYDELMHKILFAYFDAGEEDAAKNIFDIWFTAKFQNEKSVRRHRVQLLESIAVTAAKLGLKDQLVKLAEFSQQYNEMEYPSIYARTTYDPITFIYALGGEHANAVKHSESSNYNKRTPTGFDDIVKLKTASPADVRLTTYYKIAKTLAELGDTDNALFYIEKASPYMGRRTSEHHVVQHNLEDYILKADIYTLLGKKKMSENAFEGLLQQYQKTTPTDFMGGQITSGFFGRFALLYAQHRSVAELMEWSHALPSFYSGAYYARIGKLLLEEGREAEYNLYEPEMVRVFSTDEQPTSNWRHLFDSLIEHGEFDKFMRFYMAVDMGNQRDYDRQPKQFGTVLRETRPQTKNTPKQIWLMGLLLSSKLQGVDIPEDIFQEIWGQFIDNCESYRHILTRYGRNSNIKASENETMAACYSVLM